MYRKLDIWIIINILESVSTLLRYLHMNNYMFTEQFFFLIIVIVQSWRMYIWNASFRPFSVCSKIQVLRKQIIPYYSLPSSIPSLSIPIIQAASQVFGVSEPNNINIFIPPIGNQTHNRIHNKKFNKSYSSNFLLRHKILFH